LQNGHHFEEIGVTIRVVLVVNHPGKDASHHDCPLHVCNPILTSYRRILCQYVRLSGRRFSIKI
jgi:hypothetical protein